jgi:hypothetical protein
MDNVMSTKIVASILNKMQDLVDLKIKNTTTQKNKGLGLFDFGALLAGLGMLPAALGLAKVLLKAMMSNKDKSQVIIQQVAASNKFGTRVY